jgi:hypothetical protein
VDRDTHLSQQLRRDAVEELLVGSLGYRVEGSVRRTADHRIGIGHPLEEGGDRGRVGEVDPGFAAARRHDHLVGVVERVDDGAADRPGPPDHHHLHGAIIPGGPRR